MDALSFLKLLWRPTPIPTNSIPNDTQSSFAETDDDPDKDDADSFFELDVALSDVDAKSCDSPKIPINVDDDNVFLKCHSSRSGPVSPISILRSSPSFRGQMLGKSRAAERQKAGEEAGDGNRATKKSARLFTVRLKVKEVAAGSPKRKDSEPKDGFVKYLKLFRVSYVGGASRRHGYGGGGDDMRFATCGFSPSSSPVVLPKKGKPDSGFRVRYRNLGKSKSAISSSGMAVSCGGRTDDSMAEHQEGINGAILHCKKSYYRHSE